MSEGPQASGRPKGGIVAWAVAVVALAGVAAGVYIIGERTTKTAPQVATVPVPETKTPFANKVKLPAAPTPAPDYAFYDAGGKALKIADFKGKVVVMNIWATWCAPCKLEMPTLARMAAAYAGKPVEVVAVSIDTPDAAAKAREFIGQNAPLKFYHDREMKLPFKVEAPGAPTTIIYDKTGQETARVAGEADWTGPEARALIDKALAAS